MERKFSETNTKKEHKKVKNPNWQEADQLTDVDQHVWGVERGSTKNNNS